MIFNPLHSLSHFIFVRIPSGKMPYINYIYDSNYRAQRPAEASSGLEGFNHEVNLPDLIPVVGLLCHLSSEILQSTPPHSVTNPNSPHHVVYF